MNLPFPFGGPWAASGTQGRFDKQEICRSRMPGMEKVGWLLWPTSCREFVPSDCPQQEVQRASRNGTAADVGTIENVDSFRI